MPRRRIALQTADGADLRAGFATIRRELKADADFPAEVLAEAEQVARDPQLPAADRTDLDFVTLDPPGSRDLDQAMCLERRNGGYRVWYAIADVAAFVAPGGALDREAHQRGTTVYFPDIRVPLHPPVLSEGAASLLPGQDRPALVWEIDLDADGETVAARVRRAMVRSRAQLAYPDVQVRLDAGTADGSMALLAEIGPLLERQEASRGGVHLITPEQEVVEHGDGYTLQYRAALAAEDWNAQISLLAGRAAAAMMLDAGIGVLRTMPAAPPEAVAWLRRVALALDVPWADGESYGDVLRTLDPEEPRHAAFLHSAAGLLRGAGYTVFDGAPPEQPLHSAVAAPYAHVTAPLRRLVDRYGQEVCVAATEGAEVPEWVRAALPSLPPVMTGADRRNHQADRYSVDLVEATLLRDRVGERFDAVVLDVEIKNDQPTGRATVQIADPAVRGRCDGHGLPLGGRTLASLVTADPAKRQVRFSVP
ncbi:MAG: RNB domain-containing ribonuclease [Mycobacteriales bacterium]